MNALCRLALAICLVAAATVPSSAEQPEQTPATPPAAGQQPAPPEPAEPTYEETVVVSGSRAQEKLGNTPVTMTVIGPRQIESATSQNFAELLRAVPGLNITQTSARDINVTSRAATGTLATGQLALLDGRSLYQDFFGFVMWDFLPVNLNEIKQIEVIRGPASAVWGANALNGVINVITKTPREMQGTTATLGVGAFERTGGEDAGSLWYLSGTHASAINDRWAFKLSAGGYVQDPLSRPTGFIPGSPKTPSAPQGTPYPAYTNTGTTQPKFDARVDYDYEDGRQLSFTGGVSGTEGIMHTGIGPFDINDGTIMSYGRMNFARKGLRVSAFTQALDGDASNLLTRDPLGRPIQFSFKTNTSDVDLTNVQTFAKRHVLTYGGNLRYNKFDLSLAPAAENRVEFGVYAQDEIFLSDHFRLSVGGRVDRFDYLDDFVFSPRVALLVKPVQNHTFRLSYNRAYRSPSVINNFLDISIAEPLRLAPTLVYPLPVPIRRQPGPEGNLSGCLRGGVHGGSRGTNCSLGRVLRQQIQERHPLHGSAFRPVYGHEPSAGLAAVAARHPCGHRRRGVPGALHLPELWQDDAEGTGARGRHTRGAVPQRVRELLLAGEAGADGVRHFRAEPAGEEQVQPRCEHRLRAVPGQSVGQLLRQCVLAGCAR